MAISGNYSTTLGEILSRQGFRVERAYKDPSVSRHDIIFDDFGDEVGLTLRYFNNEKMLLLWPNSLDPNFLRRTFTTLKFRDYCLASKIGLEEESLNDSISDLISLTKKGNSVERQLSWELLLKI